MKSSQTYFIENKSINRGPLCAEILNLKTGCDVSQNNEWSGPLPARPVSDYVTKRYFAKWPHVRNFDPFIFSPISIKKFYKICVMSINSRFHAGE